MAERDYVSTPVADSLGLRNVILGLAEDLQQLRDGRISPSDALARAALAKQMFNGVRLYMQAVKTLEAAARDVSQPKAIEGDGE
ncbi:hypothetical protein LO749_01705 [Paracoccus denitrificans]|uniref:hypothetical protein n=1 Tax=Paracoccus denitrificans TaxID=266 RepID=UPI001E2BA0BB|nr:hypothetical protein [Paracoccus denitrificans]UFS65311.1 hypothetical protein LO749_01705 [Paracoccus denitrificans]